MRAIGVRLAGWRRLAFFLLPGRVLVQCQRCGRQDEGFSWAVLWRVLNHDCPNKGV